MSKLYETIEQLCKNKGVNITKMCKDAGVSRGSLTDLKMERSAELSTSSMSKLAEYFGVSTDYLLGKDANSVKAYDEHGEPKQKHTNRFDNMRLYGNQKASGITSRRFSFATNKKISRPQPRAGENFIYPLLNLSAYQQPLPFWI